MQLGDLGEFRLIERIRQRVVNTSQVLRGIGDDAAELKLPEGHHLLTSTDLLIEEVHFRHDWCEPCALGHKAVAVNLSDLAAMGATPRFLYLGLACPSTTEINAIEAFLEGALAEAAAHQVVLVGGDTCRSPGPWMISVTVEGSAAPEAVVGRDGARPGDLVMVTGTLGDSALALQQRSQGETPDPALWQRHVRPQPRVALGQSLAASGLVNAMIDVSDGLLVDLEHILHASKVAALLELAELPLSEPFQSRLQQDPKLLELALAGGEDYELLLTLPANAAADAMALAEKEKVRVTTIGQVSEGCGKVSARGEDGVVRPIVVRGYDHFCRSAAAHSD